MSNWNRAGNPGARHEQGRNKLRSGPVIGLEREGLKALAEVRAHGEILAELGIRYENAPESKWAPRRQWVRPARPMRDQTYGGVSAAWAVVEGMA